MREVRTGSGRDGAIAQIAARQHGVISSTQLTQCGLSSSAIGRRVATGRLHRLHRGVYAVGHVGLANEGRWMAAVLACGGGAALSHLSAAELWGMLREPRSARDELPLIHVTVGGEGKSRPGIRVHRSATLSPADVTRRFGIPVTKPTRTLEDVRRMVSDTVFASALRQAEFLGLPIGEGQRPDRTRSELEAKFLGVLRRHHLPPPEVNVRVDRYLVDFLWRAEWLIAEVDGWESHRGRVAFEADRARDNRLRVMGFKVVRFTWHQLTGRSKEVVETIRTLLAGLW